METNQDDFNAKIKGVTKLVYVVLDPESNYNSHRIPSTSADLLRELKTWLYWLVSEQMELVHYRDQELEPLFGGDGIDFREDTAERRRYDFIQANLGKIKETEPIVLSAIARLERYIEPVSEEVTIPFPEQLKTNLRQMKNEDFLTAKQAVEFLGITQSYLYKLTHKRVLPFYKPFGKMVYFKQSDLTAFFERGRIAPAEEVEQQAADYVIATKGGRQ